MEKKKKKKKRIMLYFKDTYFYTHFPIKKSTILKYQSEGIRW